MARLESTPMPFWCHRCPLNLLHKQIESPKFNMSRKVCNLMDADFNKCHEVSLIFLAKKTGDKDHSSNILQSCAQLPDP